MVSRHDKLDLVDTLIRVLGDVELVVILARVAERVEEHIPVLGCAVFGILSRREPSGRSRGCGFSGVQVLFLFGCYGDDDQ